ncbi:hypothetical protein SCHPADRAFT_835344 [Schizopora paradoxa]|uniref:Uncharacterized protein n=1 Tax=Schizopora paradoxa TaxID=27342 RepID=A0A0H2RUI0_9AGAM|nr:hypothetical protein SCHPADRAFT_835344 [Schizopora paradoxa]
MAAAAAFAQTGQNQIPSFLTDGSLPIADPNFAGLQNNEEVLRALQELDVTKLADVLRSFGQQNQLQGQPDEPQQQPIPSIPGNGDALHVGQLPAPSALLLGQPLRNPPKLPTSTAVSMPIAGTEDNAEHAHLLSTRWLTPQKLAELVKTKGVVYKKGKFSVTEEEQIKQAIEQYQRQHDLTLEQIREKIFAKGMKDRDNAFWSEITSHVPQRPIIAVYHYVRRSYHPMKQQGKWTKEEDAALKQAIVELGQSWEKVSGKVGRMAGDCRDRWRNHINHAEDRVIGTWTSEEEDMLTRIVTEMTTEQGKDPDNEVFWTQVAAKMGNKRGRQQCRIKWTDALSKTVKNSGSKPRWSQQDAFILVHKIASFDVRDDSEIDWKLLNDEDWNLWSAHCLQRRWLSLKRSVKGYEEMSHQEIMDILRVKKSSLPSSPPPPRRSRVTSAPHVPTDVQQAEAEQAQAQAQAAAFVSQPQAGPSHMPFGIPHAHPGVMFAPPPNMTVGGPGPSTMMNATHVVQAPAPAPVPPPVVQPSEVMQEEANTMFRNVMANQEEPEAGSSSSSSESSEESSESSSEVSSTSSDDDSSDSDSD